MKVQVITATSQSRPQMSRAAFAEDVDKVDAEMRGTSGVAAFTEISRSWMRAVIAEKFDGHVYHPQGTDTPIVWTPDWEFVDGGVAFGCAGILTVAPRRHIVWVILRNVHDGRLIAVIATHMMPGGTYPSARQRPFKRLINRRWRRHARRVERLQMLLWSRVSAMFTLGDINHPDAFTFGRDKRASAPGLVYIGVRGGVPGQRRRWSQNADRKSRNHRPAAVDVTLPAKGVRR